MINCNEEIFKYYFYFIHERMSIFWNRYECSDQPLTNDDIFKTYKFTNVYRASDRISQYLIKNVIYYEIEDFSERDILFRILIFKIFNKIETWEYLENNFGRIKIDSFNLERINELLTRQKMSFPIFSNAYMMTGTHSLYNYLTFKHEKWLQMIKDEILEKDILDQIIKAKSLEQVYNFLRGCSFIGDFLAYQYAIDFNYSPVVNFSEDSFVKAGIGAIRGIKKCFGSLGKHTYEYAIRFTQEYFDKYQMQFGFSEFKNLFGRKPTLIDLQNCFCETDKYLRAKVPELRVDNKRIKQLYKQNIKPIEFFFPPKWGINDKIMNPCLRQNMKELTLF
jgi:hypothetical protein